MRFVVLASGCICNLWVVVDGLLQLDARCKCNEVADEGLVNAHSCSLHLNNVPYYPAGVDHGFMMRLLQGHERNLVMLVTSFHV